MASFTDVVTGAQTLASNVNQLVDALNGTVSSQVDIISPSNSAWAMMGELGSSPAADQTVIGARVSGDANQRAGFYVRGSGGYGGIFAGPGGSTAPTAHLYATANGWNTPEGLFDNGNRVVVQGAHSTGQPIISVGNGPPTSLNNGEVYLQLT